MSNRFLDTNYYRSPFVKGLSPQLKSFYSFVICDCTAAGIWFLDFEAVKLYTGFDLDYETFEKNFIKKKKAIKISDGKYFFPDFIEHQYPGGLSDNNKAHKNILIELRKFNLLNDNNFPKKEAPLKEAFKDPLQGVQGNGLGNGQGLSNGQGNGANDYELDEREDKPKEPTDERYLLVKLNTIWLKVKPNYIKDTKKDFNALRNIAEVISTQNDTGGDILETFEYIAKYVNEHDFFKNYSLKQLDNNFQSVITSIQNGDTKSRKQATGKDVNVRSAFDTIDSFYAKNGK